ncbi:MAG: VCBS repeat-containing protein [Sporocytophaga sp.]|uniref:FG-GAP repeat domain-containing protein n=1 Tax=Sporocytophaga sp. TaxID=2231183 RepID=UPI001B026D1F|nr:VCBS repeat-containing protein [Sporocytophaga sp.]MBO9703483.1 VCBS repeat-containing protein [Sporocytophaga sp.]
MKHLITFFSLNLIFLFPLVGQVSIKQHAAYFPNTFKVGFNTSPNEPEDIAAADINNDSKQDLIYVSDKKYSVLIATDHGVFNPPVVTTVYSDLSYDGLGGIETGDFNGDNYPDLMMLQYSGSAGLSVWLNNKSGAFTKTSGLYLGSINDKFRLADFNKDNIIDVAVSINEGSSSYLNIYAGDGAGNFSLAHSIKGGNGHIHTGDLNNDAIPDIILAQGMKQISVYLSEGIYNYQKSDLNTTQSVYYVTSGDFNGDGNQDIAGSDIIVGFVLFKGNGQGQFQTPLEYTRGSAGTTLKKINLDGDNVDEVISIQNQEVTICKFSPALDVVSYQLSTTNLNNIEIQDINNDKIQDIITAPSLENLSSIITGNSNGTLNAPYAYPGFRNIAFGDGNMDGNKDILVQEAFGYYDSYLAWYTIDQNDIARLQNKILYKNLSAIHVGDLNADGNDDVIAYASDTLKFALAAPNFNFSSFSKLDTLKGMIRQMVCEDITGDGRPDLMISYESKYRDFLRIYKSQANGTFIASPLITDVTNMELADFNGDGFMDAVFSLSDQDKFRLELNDRHGNFIATDSINNIQDNFSIGDFDRNGVPDLVIKNGLFRMRVYYWNGTKLVEQPSNIYSAFDEVITNGTGDFDNDGDDDLITNWSNENNNIGTTKIHSLSEDLYNEAFSFQTDWYAPGKTFDLNNDGRIDLIQEDNSGVIFYFNNSQIVNLPIIKDFLPKTARAGEKITVSGINFSDVTNLSVGSKNIDFTIKDKNTIEFIVPIGLASGKLTTTNSFGEDQTPYLLSLSAITSLNKPQHEAIRIYPNPSEI